MFHSDAADFVDYAVSHSSQAAQNRMCITSVICNLYFKFKKLSPNHEIFIYRTVDKILVQNLKYWAKVLSPKVIL